MNRASTNFGSYDADPALGRPGMGRWMKSSLRLAATATAVVLAALFLFPVESTHAGGLIGSMGDGPECRASPTAP